MDTRIVALAALILLFAFAGLASAAPILQETLSGHGFGGRQGVNASGHSFNESRAPGDCGGAQWTRTRNETGFGGNWTNETAPFAPRMNRTGNESAPSARFANCTGNVTEKLSAFREAVESGSFEEAMQLHESCGFGGQVFGLLNESTFAKYSQVYELTNELRGELGLDQQPGIDFGLGMGPMPGFARGPHRRPESGSNGISPPP
jgi:hypothetical protein